MELARLIEQALELTRALGEALDREDLTRAELVLEQRAAALMAFQACHQRAAAAEKEACRPRTMALQAADRDLMERVLAIRDGIAREIHKAGMGVPSGHSPYLDDSKQACVNRKA